MKFGPNGIALDEAVRLMKEKVAVIKGLGVVRNQEHDCLPPLEHTGSWALSTNAVQSITEALQKLFPATFSRAAEAFEELGRLALSPRGYRKAVRWDEKNRRRRLKGLPEKPCPYPDRSL